MTKDGIVHYKVVRSPFLLCSRTSARGDFIPASRSAGVDCLDCLTYAKQLDRST